MFLFLDIDDTWEVDKIKKQLNKLKRNNCDVCFTTFDND